MERPEGDGAGPRLTGGFPHVGQLDGMVSGVADHVDERVADLLDHGPVELGLLPLDDEADLLAELDGYIPDKPAHLLERTADRHHSHGHGRPLEVGCDAAELGERTGEVLVAVGGSLNDHRLGDHEFTHEVEQAVEPGGVDADRAGRYGGGTGRGGGHRGGGRSGGLRRSGGHRRFWRGKSAARVWAGVHRGG